MVYRRPWSLFDCGDKNEAAGLGVDLDHCRDAVTGEIQDWAQEIMNSAVALSVTKRDFGWLHLAQVAQLPRAVRKRLGGNAHLLRHRQVQVGQRRLARELMWQRRKRRSSWMKAGARRGSSRIECSNSRGSALPSKLP